VQFIDEAIVAVQSGNGGRGCVSFRREKYIPKGGPDGGDGGRGGDVWFRTAPGLNTLYHFRFKRQLKAPNGAPGQGQNKAGKDGADLIVDVPVGTIVRDTEDGRILADLVAPGQLALIAKGGRGGQGNTRFKTATHRTPRFAQPGEPGQSFSIALELKLLADVGIIGLPNAGKSTLIAAISAARPRIDAYPFTTLTPTLGVVAARSGRTFVVADIPGLIQGAHQGVGLGTRFLKHIERTRILVHLVDGAAIDPAEPLAGYQTVNTELESHDLRLAAKPQIVVLNKLDLATAPDLADAFEAAFGQGLVLRISAASRQGLEPLIAKMVEMLATVFVGPRPVAALMVSAGMMVHC